MLMIKRGAQIDQNFIGGSLDDDISDVEDDSDAANGNDAVNGDDNDDEQTQGIASRIRKLATLFVVTMWTLGQPVAPDHDHLDEKIHLMMMMMKK